jgi:hypothetical protein
MKRSVLTLALVAIACTGLRADVTVTSSMTVTGPVAAFIGGGMPQMVMRIKGNRARMDMDVMGQQLSTLIDVEARQLITLTHAQKTATIVDAAGLAARAGTLSQMPAMDAKVEPTGRTETVGGQHLVEYRYTLSIDMSGLSARMGNGAGAGTAPAGLPPEAAEMMKDIKVALTGLMMVSKDGPGVSEYRAFSKAAQENMLPVGPLAAGADPSGAPGLPGMPGLSDLMRATAQLDGLPYQSEIETSFEGGGAMADMLKTMGAMKIVSKVTDVSVQPIPDEVFQVPADYTVTKQ